MEYVLTLNNIYIADEQKVGQRAVDLAQLNRDHYDIPLCFVLNAQALEDYVEHNGLKEKGARFLSENNHDALVQETRNGDFPSRMRAELREAYESISVDDSGADRLVEEGEAPNVMVFPSTDYPSKKENTGIVQNARGLAELMNAIKESWASLMSDQEFAWRDRVGVKEFFSGLIIMQMPKSEAFIRAMSKRDEDHVKVQAGFGLPDFSDELETDNFGVNKDPLKIIHHDVRTQVKRIWMDENGKLDLLPLEDRGSTQKVNDKVIIEAARLTKKMASSLEEGMKAYFSVKNEDEIELLLADRLVPSEAYGKEDDTTPLVSPGSDEYHPEEVKDYYQDKAPDDEGVDYEEDDSPQEEYTDVPEEDETDSMNKHDMDEFETVPEEIKDEDTVEVDDEPEEIPLFKPEEHEDLLNVPGEDSEQDLTDDEEIAPEISFEAPEVEEPPKFDDSDEESGDDELEEDSFDEEMDYGEDDPKEDDDSGDDETDWDESPDKLQDERDESPRESDDESDVEEDDIEKDEDQPYDESDEDSLVSEFKYDEETGESKEVGSDKISLNEVMGKVQQGMKEAENVSEHIPVGGDYGTEGEDEQDFDESDIGELPDLEPSETDDDRLEHLESMKNMIEELDGLVKKGHHDEVHRKLNRFEKEVQEFRRKHKKKDDPKA